MDSGRKRELKAAWKVSERKKLVASMPLPTEVLKALLDYLDRDNAPPCDHTLKETIHFLQSQGHSAEKVIPWLHEHGGYCDCEVIFNADDKFSEIVGG